MINAVNDNTNLVVQTLLGVVVISLGVSLASGASEPEIMPTPGDRQAQGQYSPEWPAPEHGTQLWLDRSSSAPAAFGDTCGDGLLSPGEQCDDGNMIDGDGCLFDCTIEQPDWVCTDPGMTAAEFLSEPLADAVVQGSFEDNRGRLSGAWQQSRAEQNDLLPLCSELLCPELGENVASDGVFAAVFRTQSELTDTSVVQELVIPVTATGLTFDLSVVSCDSSSDFLEITIDGNPVLNFLCDTTTDGFVTQTADISSFADGQTHSLGFRGVLYAINATGSYLIVDNVSIPLPVPAPIVAGVCEQLNSACTPVETFDGGIPADWTIVNLSANPADGWGTTDDTVCLSRNAAGLPAQANYSVGNNLTTGTNTALCADSDATGQNAEDQIPGSATPMTTYACSPALDLSTITGPEFTFNAYYQAKNNALDDNGTPGELTDDFDDDFLRVLVGTTAPTAQSLSDYTVAYEVQDHEDDELLLTGAQEIVVNLEGLLEGEPEGYVCLQYQGTFAWFAQVDNAALRGQDCTLPPVDTDGDGVYDSTDNCTLVSNPAQIDTNNDGIGNRCDPDINNDCIIAFVDIASFPPRFNSGVGDPLYDEDFDFNSNGALNFVDYLIMTSYFTQPPGPSANPCVPGLGDL